MKWNDIKTSAPVKTGKYFVSVRHFEQGASNPDWNGEHHYVEKAVFSAELKTWTFEGFYDGEMIMFKDGQTKEEESDHDWHYSLEITAWAPYPTEVYKRPKTNREAFFDFVRRELERKVKVWEDMPEEEFLTWISKENARIEFLMGRELCGYKLTKTKAISVGSIDDMRAWLKEDAE